MSKTFDLIVFDWDGTLMDSTAHISKAIQQACADLSLPIPSREQASHCIGLELNQALQQACPSATQQQLPALHAAFIQHYHHQQQQVVLFDNAVECLQAIQASHTFLAVATGNSRRGLNRLLEQTGLHALFDATRTVDECHSKPHPAMLLELTDTLGVDPQRTLMIGDTSHDLQMAINARCHSVAVSYGAHSSEHLSCYQPGAIFHSIADLQHWLLPQLHTTPG
ncbi:HAD-IA family hydrolase [Neisseriaceae bacterium TC5R-5]|nr:HAD-IA family hydrolase [Neisseriaceae bacterium TC5R-5]